MDRHTLLVTGATGTVGLEVLRLLLAQGAPHAVRLIIRASDEKHLQDRYRRLLSGASAGSLAPEDLPDWRPLRGDVEKPGLGLTEREQDALRGEVTAILHSAANVHFDAPLDECRAINVQGTRHALDFARRCTSLSRFGHVSSLYVAGRRSGPVLESELVHDAGFVTYGYEQSKYEAELALRDYPDVPTATYRLSLMLGREQDGYVHDFGALHQFLQYVWQGICPCIPAHAECPLDILPSDYSVRCMMKLFFEHFAPAQTFQISAAKKTMTARRWMDLTGEVYSQHSKSWRKGIHIPPDTVTWQHYKLYCATVDTIDNPALRKVTRVLDSCSEELFFPKLFDRSRVDQVLGTAPGTVPDYEDYYPRILEYCIATRWGRELS
jgi:thioester reductase-like protein